LLTVASEFAQGGELIVVISMTPGADPLPALKAPLACLCEQWREELPSSPLLGELADWAGQ